MLLSPKHLLRPSHGSFLTQQNHDSPFRRASLLRRSPSGHRMGRLESWRRPKVLCSRRCSFFQQHPLKLYCSQQLRRPSKRRSGKNASFYGSEPLRSYLCQSSRPHAIRRRFRTPPINLGKLRPLLTSHQQIMQTHVLITIFIIMLWMFRYRTHPPSKNANPTCINRIKAPQIII